MPPFDIVNPAARAPVLLICDHAGRIVPSHLNGLGVAKADLERHIAWDIGAGDVTGVLAGLLGATAVLSRISRLVVDLNRDPECPGCIPISSDGTRIPGNVNLSQDETELRLNRYFVPYHAAIEAEIARLSDSGAKPVLLFIHSFTPRMEGFDRPWHAGVLWNRDGRLALPLIERLRAVPGLCVGDNQPYSGLHLAYSMNRHAGPSDLMHAGIEIRQDLIDRPDKAGHWAGILARALQPLVSM